MIKEIWAKMTQGQRDKVTAALILDGASSSAVYAWTTGKRVPMKLYREALSRYINKHTEFATTPESLWPANDNADEQNRCGDMY